MRKTINRILIFISLIVVAICIYFAYEMWRSAEKAAILSCLASIASETDEALQQNRLEINGVSRELTQTEIENLLGGSKKLDCSSQQTNWGKIHIAIGEVNKIEKQVKVKVWINGNDGIPNTSDDLTFPLDGKEF
jgi:hypothetical protein